MNSLKTSPSSQGSYIKANGLNIFYRESGQGPSLILIHGATDTHRLWEPHLSVLSKHFWLITPDSRGHGRTLNPSRKLNYQLMADDLAAFIQKRRLIKPFLFGYSDGGQVVLDFAMRYPDLPGALVIGGAWYRFSDEYQAAITGSGFTSPGKVDFDVFEKNAPPDWEERMQSAHTDPDSDYPRILLESLAQMWWTPLNYTEDEFKKITAPTLIIMGEKDEMIPLAEAEEMAALIPGAELAVIPGAKHNDVLKPSGEFTGKLVSFLTNKIE
jgi:pimeloyl-ACP methyl ester carboxylesterase